MAALNNLCVFCGSSNDAPPSHLETARQIGKAAAQRQVAIVYGGGRVGLMGAVADGALAAGGKVIGIIPQHLEDREVGHRAVTEYLVVDSMHSRKNRMYELSDAFCVLPGGLGTLDEAFEIITWKMLQLHDKPVVLLNQEDYWTPLLDLIAHQTKAGYVPPKAATLFQSVASIEQVFATIDAAPAPRFAADSSRL